MEIFRNGTDLKSSTAVFDRSYYLNESLLFVTPCNRCSAQLPFFFGPAKRKLTYMNFKLFTPADVGGLTNYYFNLSEVFKRVHLVDNRPDFSFELYGQIPILGVLQCANCLASAGLLFNYYLPDDERSDESVVVRLREVCTFLNLEINK